MMLPDEIKRVWLIGIGGIGMSALARYFKLRGCMVAGYDRTPSPVTDALQEEGIEVVFDENPDLIGPPFRAKEGTLIIFTPAVGEDQAQLIFFREGGFTVMKRAQVLGLVSRGSRSVCIAGTHGKTTITTLTAHLYRESSLGCCAFLGGIAKNFNTNFLWDETSEYVVLEADEFDRSFLWLRPYTALISAVDADHLDVYGTRESFLEAFAEFASGVVSGGSLLIKDGLPLDLSKLDPGVNIYTYSLNSKRADFYAENIRIDKGSYCFDLMTPAGVISGLEMGIPGLLNVENAVGAMGLALLNGVQPDEIRRALPMFRGIRRRFDIWHKTEDFAFIDDYAHHPEEIRATVQSVRLMYPGYHLTGVFQPHLYTRTRDFADGFADALSLLDEVVLADIYPAREEPIPGITSRSIGELISGTPVTYVEYDKLIESLTPRKDVPQVILTMGAGDIDRLVPVLAEKFKLLKK